MKKKSKIIIFVSLLFTALVLFAIFKLSESPCIVVRFFQDNVRNSLFGGFLSLGGFLFSMKTFIIIKMKETVYDSQIYQDEVFAKHKALDSSKMLYGPLQRLTNLLFWVVVGCFLTAISQLTVGLLNHWAATFWCIGIAIFTLCLIIACLMLIMQNLRDMFSIWNELADKRLNKIDNH